MHAKQCARTRRPRQTRPAGTLRAASCGLGVWVLVLLTGCQAGVRWSLPSYDSALEDAQQRDQLTFVYFRNWYSTECYHFEEDVLKHPDVLAETRRMVCVPLEFDQNRALAKRWNITRVPAFALVTPEERIVAQGAAPITVEELLTTMRNCLGSWAAHTQPATPP